MIEQGTEKHILLNSNLLKRVSSRDLTPSLSCRELLLEFSVVKLSLLINFAFT